MEHDPDRPPGGETPALRPGAQERIRKLAQELGRLAREEPARLTRSVAQLTLCEQAELALRLPVAERLELLLHAPAPLRLVRILPDADFYLTVREAGPTEALPLLALASPDQLQHLFDLEAWRHDRFDPDRAGAWTATLLESGEPTLKRFLRTADESLLALLCRSWMRIEMIEGDDSPGQHGHGEGDAGTELGVPTPDGYYRFSPTIPEHTSAIRSILQYFFVHDPQRYQQVVWDSIWRLPSELEEELLHWRNSRLDEHGFPGWDEALAVYAPPEGLSARAAAREADDSQALGASRRALMAGDPAGALVESIDTLSGAARERVLHEVFSVANRLLVADSADTGDPEAHRAAMRKAVAYIQIALAHRSDAGQTPRESLEQVPAIELFREGHAGAAELQRRARRLQTQGWAAVHPRALEWLDEPVRGRIRGLLELRPLFAELDEARRTVTLRDFRSREELAETRAAVELGETLGRLFVERLGLDLVALLRTTPAGASQPTCSTLFLTLLAWHAARDLLSTDPLPGEVAADFLRNVASRRTAAPDAATRAAEGLVRRLVDRLDLQPRDVALLQAFSRFAVERLAAECGALDPGVPPAPQSVGCLRLRTH